jgi:hypothetical protein
MIRVWLAILAVSIPASSIQAQPVVSAVYDVVEYGAIPDDAVDDTVEIRAAVADAGLGGGGRVYFQNGVYDISGAITIPADNIQLVGDGIGSVLSMTSQGGAVLFMIGRQHIVIRDLYIAEKNPGSLSTGSAIRVLGNSSDILVENVRVTGFGKSFQVDPDVGERADHITLRNVWGEGGRDWGFEIFRADHVLFDNVVAKGNGNDGFKIGQGTSRWELRGGRATGNAGDGADILGSGPGWRIVGTRFDDNGVAGINVKTSIGVDKQEGSIIGALVEENHGTGLDFFVGPGDPFPHHISVQGGLFARNGKCGIRVQAGRSITLDGVIVYENDQCGIFVDDRSLDIDIVGAQVSANGRSAEGIHPGVIIEGDRVTMVGGTVDGKDQDTPTGGTAMHKHAIFVSANASKVVVDGVAVKNATSTLVRDDAADTALVNVDGWVTRNRGQTTLLDNTTFRVVAHGLSVTPKIDEIRVTPTTGWGSARSFWVSNPTSIAFRINVDVDPNTDLGFVWEADASGR